MNKSETKLLKLHDMILFTRGRRGYQTSSEVLYHYGLNYVRKNEKMTIIMAYEDDRQ